MIRHIFNFAYLAINLIFEIWVFSCILDLSYGKDEEFMAFVQAQLHSETVFQSSGSRIYSTFQAKIDRRCFADVVVVTIMFVFVIRLPVTSRTT